MKFGFNINNRRKCKINKRPSLAIGHADAVLIRKIIIIIIIFVILFLFFFFFF